MKSELGLQAGDRYEHSDAQPRSLVLFALALACLILVSLAVCAWIASGLTARIRSGESPSPLGELRTPPPGPALEVLPARELAAVRAREDELLGSTAWIDPLNGIVRIPIERALEIVAREGLAAPAAPAENGAAKESKQ